MMRKLFCLFAAVSLASCLISASAQSPHVKASEWVAGADWGASTLVVVEMVESGSLLTFSPNHLTFEAGQPYILRLQNSAANILKHDLSPDVTNSFFQVIATRKVQTIDAEYKAPYFDEVELFIGGSVDIYFIPVRPGTYDLSCTVAGHAAAGMTAQVTITGGQNFQLDLEVDPNFDPTLIIDDRREGSHAVWGTAQEINLQMVEGPSGSLAFDPPELRLQRDSGYQLNLINSSTNNEKHYYAAAEFYRTVVTRKAEDSRAEVKVPYFNTIELLIGGRTELFFVPTADGDFEVICTIPGHHDLGMHGTISVNTSTRLEDGDVPEEFRLWVNYPNPFNPSTTISYSLPLAADVRLTVVDMQGRQVKERIFGTRPAGTHHISFDASNLPAGVYLYRLTAGDVSLTKAMTLLK